MSNEDIDAAVQQCKKDMFSMRIKFAKREVRARWCLHPPASRGPAVVSRWAMLHGQPAAATSRLAQPGSS